MLNVSPRLDDELEELIHRVIGCGIAVHRALGPGLLERIYIRAISIELQAAGISHEIERSFPVYYRGLLLSEQRVDLVVAGRVVLEIKAVDRLAPVHHAQVMSYLRMSKLKVGLLMNFNVAVLPDGLHRIVM